MICLHKVISFQVFLLDINLQGETFNTFDGGSKIICLQSPLIISKVVKLATIVEGDPKAPF